MRPPPLKNLFGKVSRDAPIIARFAQRLNGFVAHLDSPLGVGERAGFFGKGHAGQQHVGVLGSLRRKDFLENNELTFFKTMTNMF